MWNRGEAANGNANLSSPLDCTCKGNTGRRATSAFAPFRRGVQALRLGRLGAVRVLLTNDESVCQSQVRRSRYVGEVIESNFQGEHFYDNAVTRLLYQAGSPIVTPNG